MGDSGETREGPWGTQQRLERDPVGLGRGQRGTLYGSDWEMTQTGTRLRKGDDSDYSETPAGDSETGEWGSRHAERRAQRLSRRGRYREHTSAPAGRGGRSSLFLSLGPAGTGVAPLRPSAS